MCIEDRRVDAMMITHSPPPPAPIYPPAGRLPVSQWWNWEDRLLCQPTSPARAARAALATPSPPQAADPSPTPRAATAAALPACCPTPSRALTTAPPRRPAPAAVLPRPAALPTAITTTVRQRVRRLSWWLRRSRPATPSVQLRRPATASPYVCILPAAPFLLAGTNVHVRVTTRRHLRR